MTRVSVIIPTHNRAHVVSQAIDSLLAQTYRDLEIIVVDDGSTDNTQDVVSGYPDRVTYIYQRNAGPAAARNTGIRAAQGELLAFLDSDDTVSPTKLATQVTYLDARPDVGVVYSGWQLVSEDGKIVHGEMRPTREGEILKELLLEWALFPIHSTLMRRECIERAGLFDESLPTYEDPDFWIRIAKAGFRFGCIEEPLCQYRLTDGSLGKDLAKLERTVPVVLQKVFDDPELPTDIAGLRDEVYARRYLAFALFYYYAPRSVQSARECEIAQNYLSRAFALKPDILTGDHESFDLITHKAIELEPDDPDAHIRNVVSTLFSKADKWRRLQSRLLGRLHVILAFQTYQTNRRAQVVFHVLQGVRYDPTWLKNRGVISIFFRSLPRLLENFT